MGVGGLVRVLPAEGRADSVAARRAPQSRSYLRAGAQRLLPDGHRRASAARAALLDPANLQLVAVPPATLRAPARVATFGKARRLPAAGDPRRVGPSDP